MNLKQLASAWLAYKGNSVHVELGLTAWGKLRADLWAFRTVQGRTRTTLVELKSGYADFATDLKFHKYREFAHQCYLAIDLSKLNPKQRSRVRSGVKKAGFGLLDIATDDSKVLSRRVVSLKVKAVIPCKMMETDTELIHAIFKRIAFRSGIHKRNLRDRIWQANNS